MITCRVNHTVLKVPHFKMINEKRHLVLEMITSLEEKTLENSELCNIIWSLPHYNEIQFTEEFLINAQMNQFLFQLM